MSNYFKFFPTTVYDNRLITDITRRTRIVEQLSVDPYALLPYVITEGERPEDVAYYYYGDQNKVWMVYLANNIIDPYTQWPLDDSNLYQTLVKKYSVGPIVFGNGDVDVVNNTIRLTGHGLKTTDPIRYTNGLTAPAPLNSGTTYYAVFVDENIVKLATTAANATNGITIDITSVGAGSFTRDLDVFFNSTNITSNIMYCVNVTDPSVRITYDTYAYGGVVTSEWNIVRVYEHEVQENENKRQIYLINRNYASQVQTDLRKVINE